VAQLDELQILLAQWEVVGDPHVPIEQVCVTEVPAVHDCMHVPVGKVHAAGVLPSQVA
jgi:hypothetical protein